MKASFVLPVAAGILFAASAAVAAPEPDSSMPGAQGAPYQEAAPAATTPDAATADTKAMHRDDASAGKADKKDTTGKTAKKKMHKHSHEEEKEPAASGS